ncbi:SDR family NAD(P)-dependent oxidoreductase [Chloroflexota bacterium]
MGLLSKFRLDSKVAIVTGSGTGIGKGIALGFASAGADVVVAERNQGTGRATAREIQALGRKALPVVVDVTNSKQVTGLVQAAVKEFGRIDIMVNNVGGTGPVKPVVDTGDEEWEGAVRLNLTSIFLCSREAGRVMLKQGGGNIINIASSAAIRAVPGVAPYASCKAGVLNFTRCLATELARYHIRANCIIPGSVETELGTALRGPAHERVAQTGVPLGRIGTPEDMALAAIYLASDASDYLTGTAIEVLGGPYIRKGDLETFVARFPDLPSIIS